MIQDGIDKKTWKAIAKRAGFPPGRNLKYISRGAYARTWVINKHRVLKITADSTDAKSAKHYMDNPNPCVVRVHDVFQINNTHLYAIIVSRMEHLSEEWVNFIWYTARGPYAAYSKDSEKAFKALDKEVRQRQRPKIAWIRRFHRFQKDTGFVTNDLHTKNIMLDARGWPRVSDLGCSKNAKYIGSIEVENLSISAGHGDAKA